MANVLRISEGASLALHSMLMLAARPSERLSTGEIAKTFDVSEAHLSKVLQRLTRVGLLNSVRGPRGGFKLAKSAEDISLLEIYETIDGPLGTNGCLLGDPVCSGEHCLLGGLVKATNDQMREYLATTSLAQAAGKCGGQFVATEVVGEKA